MHLDALLTQEEAVPVRVSAGQAARSRLAGEWPAHPGVPVLEDVFHPAAGLLTRIVDPFGHHWEIGKPLSEG